MNKFPISLKPGKWPVNGRTNQHINLEQTMVFRIIKMAVRNLVFYKYEKSTTSNAIGRQYPDW